MRWRYFCLNFGYAHTLFAPTCWTSYSLSDVVNEVRQNVKQDEYDKRLACCGNPPLPTFFRIYHRPPEYHDKHDKDEQHSYVVHSFTPFSRYLLLGLSQLSSLFGRVRIRLG